MKLMLLIVVHEVVIIAHLNWTLFEGVFKLFIFLNFSQVWPSERTGIYLLKPLIVNQV